MFWCVNYCVNVSCYWPWICKVMMFNIDMIVQQIFVTLFTMNSFVMFSNFLLFQVITLNIPNAIIESSFRFPLVLYAGSKFLVSLRLTIQVMWIFFMYLKASLFCFLVATIYARILFALNTPGMIILLVFFAFENFKKYPPTTFAWKWSVSVYVIFEFIQVALAIFSKPMCMFYMFPKVILACCFKFT